MKKNIIILLFLCLLVLLASNLYKHNFVNYSNERIANAIYKAEGGQKTKHPYGILTKYENTTPKQACINTINHARKDWNGKGDFIEFLGKRYCPQKTKIWIKNVKFFLDNDN
jgi:hypothetical protein